MKHLFYHLLLCIHSSLIKCGLKCKGSTYSFFLQNCNFLITFFESYRNIKYIMLSIFRTIEVFFKKIDKTASKILNQEEHGQSENEKFWNLWKSYSPPVINVFWFFLIDESYYLTRFCGEFFLTASLMSYNEECWYVTNSIGFGHFFLKFPRHYLS